MNTKLSQQKLAICLVCLSLFLWALSLLLAGYTFEDGNSDKGLYILIYGIFLGWLATSSWTVYSNIFYLIACILILLGKKPKKTVIFMLPFALWLFVAFFYEYKITVDVGHEKPVASWGWGAVLLLFAQSLLVISALLTHKKISVRNTYITIGLLILPLIGIAILGYSQRSQANEWELKHYFLTYDIAFTKRQLSELPYKPLTEKLPENTIIAIEFIDDMPLTITENEYTYPNVYWQYGKLWRKYNSHLGIDGFSVMVNNQNSPNYRLIFTHPKPQFYQYTLYDANDNIIKQQSFIKRKQYNDYFFPSLYQMLKDIRYVEKRKAKLLLWQSEIGRQACTVKQIPTDTPFKTIWQLDKNQIIVFNSNVYSDKPEIKFYANQALCSENYLIALAFNHDIDRKSVYDAWLFERKTGFPIAKFSSGRNSKNILRVTESDIKQFELVVLGGEKNQKDKSYLILHTDKGNIKLPLLERQKKIYR